jgi:hypothetical protein
MIRHEYPRVDPDAGLDCIFAEAVEINAAIDIRKETGRAIVSPLDNMQRESA